MAVTSIVTKNYLQVEYTEWQCQTNTGLEVGGMLDPNSVRLIKGASRGNLTTYPFPIAIGREIESIELLWDQFNCSTLSSNVRFVFMLSSNNGSSWTTSMEYGRTTPNGNKVKLADLIPPGQSVVLGDILCKFSLTIQTSLGYNNPSLAHNLKIYFNFKVDHAQSRPPTMPIQCRVLNPTVRGSTNFNANINAPVMELRGTLQNIEPMNSWDGNHAKISVPVLNGDMRSINPDRVYATGALHGVVEPGPFVIKGKVPEPFVKDQEVAEIVCEDLILQKEIELEVEIYDI